MLTTHCHTISQEHSLPQSQFSSLNMSALSISFITPVPIKLLFISQLNLDNNLLRTLSGIDQFMNLQCLSLNFNFISEIDQLLHIRNKFMLKELSLIGNEIETKITGEWLKYQGFTQLQYLNSVNRIGHVSNYNQIYSENQSPTFYTEKPYFYQSTDHLHIKSSPKPSNPSSRQPTSTKRFTHSNHNDPYQHSIINQSHPDITQRLTKPKDRFQSTGDTRNQNKASPKDFNSTSNNSKWHYDSPQFNNLSFQQQHYSKGNQSTMKRDNVTEFRLYPVNEGKEQKRYKGSQQQMYYQKKVRPFQVVQERDSYGRYRSEVYELDEREYNNNKMRVISQQSDNNVIEREIPVYKQAIAIAYYYRNLLEKVFRGYNQIIAAKNQNQRKYTDSSHSNQQQKSINSASIPSQNSSSIEQQVNSKELKKQSLKRYAWMKLQLYAYNKKITQKYLQSINTQK